ncbi:hypothetical protein [Natrononativus amylolyticus]|nr:hypothetical protein [Natrononativus amylolyticus]
MCPHCRSRLEIALRRPSAGAIEIALETTEHTDATHPKTTSQVV